MGFITTFVQIATLAFGISTLAKAALPTPTPSQSPTSTPTPAIYSSLQ